MILIMAEAIGEIGGALIAASLLCWLLWNVFRLLHRPAWAMWSLLPVPVLALAGKLPDSEFLGMTLAFAAIGTIPFWIDERTSRNRSVGPRVGMQGAASAYHA
jgi:hypothetical protein